MRFSAATTPTTPRWSSTWPSQAARPSPPHRGNGTDPMGQIGCRPPWVTVGGGSLSPIQLAHSPLRRSAACVFSFTLVQIAPVEGRATQLVRLPPPPEPVRPALPRWQYDHPPAVLLFGASAAAQLSRALAERFPVEWEEDVLTALEVCWWVGDHQGCLVLRCSYLSVIQLFDPSFIVLCWG